MTAPKNNEQEGKPQPSLIPLDLLIKILEPAYREGLIKYRRESWREGFHTTIMMDAAERHLSAHFYDGEDFDPDAKKLGINKTHLGGALFSILCMAHTMLNHPELDNRPGKMRKGVADKVTGKIKITAIEDEKRNFLDPSDDTFWTRDIANEEERCPICGATDCDRFISKDGRCK